MSDHSFKTSGMKRIHLATHCDIKEEANSHNGSRISTLYMLVVQVQD